MIIICFPHAGGISSHYHFTKALEKHGNQVILYDYNGRGTKFAQPLYENFAQAIKEISLDVLNYKGEVALFGHSMGGYIAYEVALFLERFHNKILEIVIVSSISAPKFYKHQNLCSLDESEIQKYIQSSVFGEDATHLQKELMDLIVPVLKNDFRIIEENYPSYSIFPIQAKLVSLYGKDDSTVTPSNMAAWSEYSINYSNNICFEGGHFFPLHEQEKFVDCIQDIIKEG